MGVWVVYETRSGVNEVTVEATMEWNALSIAQYFSIAVQQGVDHWDDIGCLRQALLLLCGHQTPELVDVDDRSPELVAGEMEMAHTNFTEVTRMVLIEIGTISSPMIRVSQREMYCVHTGDDADHQRDHDHPDACGAFLHDRGRRRHDRDACGSWRDG